MSNIDNRFIKLTEAELSVNLPKRGAYSRLEALMDLKMLLFSCNRETVRNIQGEKVKLGIWEEAVSLKFLQQRWKWNDKTRVTRTLVQWARDGSIRLRKGKRHNFNIIGLTIAPTTLNATFHATDKATDNITENQGVSNGHDTTSTTLDTTTKATFHATNIKNIRNKKKEEIFFYYNAHARYKKSIFEKQIIALLNFFSDEIGEGSLQKACEEYKIDFPPSTKCLVEQVEQWALQKYTTKSGVLAGFGEDGWKCWGDFYRNWMKYLESDWKKKERPRRKGKSSDIPKTYKSPPGYYNSHLINPSAVALPIGKGFDLPISQTERYQMINELPMIFDEKSFKLLKALANKHGRRAMWQREGDKTKKQIYEGYMKIANESSSLFKEEVRHKFFFISENYLNTIVSM